VTKVHAAAGALVVMANLTVTGPTKPGFTTVYPCTSTRPTASNSNFTAGQTVASFVIAETDAHGDVCIYTSSATQLIWDQVGTTGTFSVGNPRRVLDTRNSG
jgi:hypothetical protein